MIGFNPSEVFEMAQQMERDGAAFYRKAAGYIDDSGANELLLRLAAMEDEHEKTFAEMEKELTSRERMPNVGDPYGEASLYLASLVDGKVFDPKDSPASTLTGQESIQEILETAIGLEKSSILFYIGMKDSMADDRGKGRIDGIIKEEMGHIVVLRKELQERS